MSSARDLGRGGSKAVGEGADPIKKDLRTSNNSFKISILSRRSNVSCNILKQSVLASTKRDFERWMSTSIEFAICLITESVARIPSSNSK